MEQNNINDIEDDGSLSFLNIPKNEESKSFNCDIITQQKLVNTQFWVFGYFEDIPTKFSKNKGTTGQTLVHIRYNKEDSESDGKKFFTGSADILYILQQIKARDAFPRKVTMRAQGNKYFLE